jgi:homoserine kinase
MRRVKITLPAVATDIGPGQDALGLALGLYTVVEFSERSDRQFVLDTRGEGAGRYSVGLQHPVALAMMRVFQQAECAPLSVHVVVDNHIPIESGLSAETAFHVAGVIGASNLLGSPLTREQALAFAVETGGSPVNVAAAVLGGLAAGFSGDAGLVYRRLAAPALQVIVALPEIDSYSRRARGAVPERAALSDALANLSRVPLLIEGLRAGDPALIARALDDRLRQPRLTAHIPGYGHVAEIARRAGALGITVCGGGPALIAFAPARHPLIAAAIVEAFDSAGVKARAWVLPVDTQGVVISAAQSS